MDCAQANFPGPVLVLTTYDQSRSLSYRNAIVRGRPVIRNYHGYNVAYSEGPKCNEGARHKSQQIGIFQFSNIRDCRLWLESDDALKQKDFLDGVGIIVLPLNRSDADIRSYPIVEIVEGDAHFDDCWHKTFANTLEQTVHQFGGIPMVVCTDKPLVYRGFDMSDTYVVNLFPNWEAYCNYNRSEEYKKMLDTRDAFGCGSSVAYEVKMLEAKAAKAEQQCPPLRKKH